MAWLPQPATFADDSVEAQTGDPTSTLTIYRAALRLRRRHQHGDDDVTWCSDHDDRAHHFCRSNGWTCFVSFGTRPAAQPSGEIQLASGPIIEGQVPTDTTIWTR